MCCDVELADKNDAILCDVCEAQQFQEYLKQNRRGEGV